MKGFRDIIGQEMSVNHLKNTIKTGHTAHAYIFDGEKGMGKKTLAMAFAKALQCESKIPEREDTEPCGICRSCIMADSMSHPDIICVTHEKASSIGVDEIRSQVVGDVPVKPYSSERKIYIIPDAHLMTVEAQNSLLKTLEEPPEYITIILLPDNKDMLLPTLISRAVCLPMRAVKNEDIAEYLKETKNLPPEDTRVAVSFAQGNLGKAEMLSESEEFKELWEAVRSLLTGISEMTDSMIAQAAEEAASRKEQRKEYLSFLLLWFRDVLYLKSDGDPEKLIFSGEIREIERQASRCSYEKLNRITEGIKTAFSRMNSNVNPEYTYEMLFMIMR